MIEAATAMKPNPGFCPLEAEGKRVRVKLANGHVGEWAADGRGGCRWTIEGHEHDIAEYEVIR